MRKNKRIIMAMAIILAIATVVAGSTFAWFTSVDTADNHHDNLYNHVNNADHNFDHDLYNNVDTADNYHDFNNNLNNYYNRNNLPNRRKLLRSRHYCKAGK